uniref:RNA-directed DNA polymerase, eukaryota, reverse transcriptase zinc-binding domain protein n=1 Tax=Tanacetum cinerariifolium TaxID=118510 RepID=A0A6L2JQL6_TANCI|nr:RNA-directed DNA polymerase, eukaryota, reverse transcriptase zinc-binding domain protein [Tanacetum cinerariifolium]
MDLLSLMKKKLGNGLDTSFWDVVWRGDSTFKSRFPIVYALELNKLITVAAKLAHADLGFSLRRSPRDGTELEQFSKLKANIEGVQLPLMKDRWCWSLTGSGDFSISSVRKYIDDHQVIGSTSKTRWVKAVPIKINVMAWKEVESTRHVFFDCSMVRDLYRKIASWWDISYSEFSSYEEWLEWLLNLSIQSDHRNILERVFYVM